MSTPTNAPSLSPAARQAVVLALRLLKDGEFDDAAELHDRVAVDFPNDPELAYLEAELALVAGDSSRAADAIARAAAGVPASLPLRLREADILATARQRSKAIAAAQAAQALAGGDGAVLWAIGRVHSRCGDPLAARALYEQALATVDDPSLRYDLAVTCFFVGDEEAAEHHFDELLQRAPGVGAAAYIRSTVRRQTPQRNHVDSLRQMLAQPLNDENRAGFLFALAKELEDLGDDAGSFDALHEGARLRRAALQHDSAAELDTIQAIADVFDAETLAKIEPANGGHGAIFIVGMPRTGTTLLEHLLARHAHVPSAGELPDFGDALRQAVREAHAARPDRTLVEVAATIDFAALGRSYMDTARQAAGGSAAFVDKMPINYMYCGLIHKALPEAKIVHLVRDPMDTCYAVYKTLFSDAYLFSYDLDELAGYFITYRRLMDHWHRVLPGAILDVRYEDLVRDPQGELKRVLDWCGLEERAASDDPALSRASMTASAAQVRQPVHTGSIGKWKAHAAHLEPLREQLVAAGVCGDRAKDSD